MTRSKYESNFPMGKKPQKDRGLQRKRQNETRPTQTIEKPKEKTGEGGKRAFGDAGKKSGVHRQDTHKDHTKSGGRGPIHQPGFKGIKIESSFPRKSCKVKNYRKLGKYESTQNKITQWGDVVVTRGGGTRKLTKTTVQ